MGFIHENNQEVWISFFGAIFGGLFTLLGVYITLWKQDTIRKEDTIEKEKKELYALSLQYKPILKIHCPDSSKNSIIKYHGIDCIKLKLTNIGRGEAIDCQYSQNTIRNKSDLISFIPSQTSFDLLVPIPKGGNNRQVELEISYWDFVKQSQYITTSTVHITFNGDELKSVECMFSLKINGS